MSKHSIRSGSDLEVQRLAQLLERLDPAGAGALAHQRVVLERELRRSGPPGRPAGASRRARAMRTSTARAAPLATGTPRAGRRPRTPPARRPGRGSPPGRRSTRGRSPTARPTRCGRRRSRGRSRAGRRAARRAGGRAARWRCRSPHAMPRTSAEPMLRRSATWRSDRCRTAMSRLRYRAASSNSCACRGALHRLLEPALERPHPARQELDHPVDDGAVLLARRCSRRTGPRTGRCGSRGTACPSGGRASGPRTGGTGTPGSARRASRAPSSRSRTGRSRARPCGAARA